MKPQQPCLERQLSFKGNKDAACAGAAGGERDSPRLHTITPYICFDPSDPALNARQARLITHLEGWHAHEAEVAEWLKKRNEDREEVKKLLALIRQEGNDLQTERL